MALHRTLVSPPWYKVALEPGQASPDLLRRRRTPDRVAGTLVEQDMTAAVSLRGQTSCLIMDPLEEMFEIVPDSFALSSQPRVESTSSPSLRQGNSQGTKGGTRPGRHSRDSRSRDNRLPSPQVGRRQRHFNRRPVRECQRLRIQLFTCRQRYP